MSELVRMISNDGTLVCMAADTTDIIAEMQKLHKTSKVCSAALGRLLTAASLMGSSLKNKQDSITVKINGKGPCGSVVAVSNSDGDVKGYIGDSRVNLPLNKKGKLDVGTAIGKDGFLTVIKDLGMKEPYIGQIPIATGEVAEDITAYFAMSEQTPSVCGLGVLVNSQDETIISAGGFIIQLLPTAFEDTITMVEDGLKNIDSVTGMLTKGMTPEDICRAVLPKFTLELLDSSSPKYYCDCSRERVKKALIATGKDGLLEMAQDEKTEAICHFCNKKYTFSKQEVTNLLKSSID